MTVCTLHGNTVTASRRYVAASGSIAGTLVGAVDATRVCAGQVTEDRAGQGTGPGC